MITTWFITIALITTVVQTGSVTVTWDDNTEPDLFVYRVYYGLESRNYIWVVDVGLKTEWNLDHLQSGIKHYFAVTAYDNSFNESDYSDEVSLIVI